MKYIATVYLWKCDLCDNTEEDFTAHPAPECTLGWAPGHFGRSMRFVKKIRKEVNHHFCLYRGKELPILHDPDCTDNRKDRRWTWKAIPPPNRERK